MNCLGTEWDLTIGFHLDVATRAFLSVNLDPFFFVIDFLVPAIFFVNDVVPLFSLLLKLLNDLFLGIGVVVALDSGIPV